MHVKTDTELKKDKMYINEKLLYIATKCVEFPIYIRVKLMKQTLACWIVCKYIEGEVFISSHSNLI